MKIIELKKFSYTNDIIYTMSPEFESIQFSSPSGDDEEIITITEKFHLDGIEENLEKIYLDIKEKILILLGQVH